MYAAPVPGTRPTEHDANTLRSIYSSRSVGTGGSTGQVVRETIVCEE